MTGKSDSRNVAALLGNGVSIAYNSDLAVPKLTADVMAIYNALSNSGLPSGSPRDQAARALATLAQKLSSIASDPESNFEQLLSPLEEIGDALTVLQEVTHLYGNVDPSIGSRVTSVMVFCNYVRMLGLSSVLELVDQRARASTDVVVSSFVKQLAQATEGRLLIGTLNYDHLVDAALLNQYSGKHSDMATGLNAVSFELEPGQRHTEVRGWGMRHEFDFTLDSGWSWSGGRRIVTLHLHGSLALLRDTRSGDIFRFQMQDLRSNSYWQLYREGRTPFEPVVVLTNQQRKSRLVQSEPFRTAYSGFTYGLLSSELWLIAGYSFQDQCVNEVLRDVWKVRISSLPRILISTFGSDPEIEQIYEVLGADNAAKKLAIKRRIEFHRQGVAQVAGSSEWKSWLN